jgi:WD40 repeat protein
VESVRAGDSSAIPVKIVPKGLRSFESEDADFFLELLPGARDRDGLPESVRFWKTRIEATDADRTFNVGLIYGPSGCGKSSLVKAALLPRLARHIIPVYVEAVADQTEARLLKAIRKQTDAAGSNLKEVLAAIRCGRGMQAGKKLLIVLDQFEQWLHARRLEDQPELVQALRQCDGAHVQCLILVRDDFWLTISRFMKELEVRVVERENSALVDLFSLPHARKVLACYGRAFGVLPEGALAAEENRFLEQACVGLAENDKVICVQLALFAEMVKSKPWNLATLKAIGGVTGVGVTFLEETFSAQSAPLEHRAHQKAARAVLKALLPESGTDIKGNMRSLADLRQASGYSARPADFDELLQILDARLRLVTPTDPDGTAQDAEPNLLAARASELAPRYYQLTHDYLVPALRDWLTRKQKETRRGRAELRLAERSAAWNARPQNRHLPAWWEWANIRLCTRKRDWSAAQQKMMRTAAHYHLVRGLILFAVLGAIGGYAAIDATEKARALAEQRAKVDEANRNLAESYKELLVAKNQADESGRKAETSAARATEEASNSRRNLYLAQVNLADNAWRAGQVDQALHWLRQISSRDGATDLRGFEFHQLARLCRAELATLPHDGQVMGVAFSPDGRLLASASNQSIRIWDVAERRSITSIPQPARAVVFHPDCRRMVTIAYDDRSIHLWDANSGRELRTLKGHTLAVQSVAFSPDGKQLASATTNTVREQDGTPVRKEAGEVFVWETESGRRLLALTDQHGGVESVAFSPDGALLACGSEDRTVRIREAETGRTLRTLQCQDVVLRVAFGGDGLLAVGCGNNYRIPADILLYKVADGHLVRRLTGHKALIWGVAFSPDGKRLASASGDETVRIWDVGTGRELCTYRDVNWVFSVAFSPDGRLIASAGNSWTVKLWDAGGDQEPRTPGHRASGWLAHAAFSMDGKRLAALGPRGVYLWDTITGLEIDRFPGSQDLVFSPDGRFLATVGPDHLVMVRDARTGHEVRALPGALPVPDQQRMMSASLAFSADGRRLSAAASDSSVRVWDVTTGQAEPATQLGAKNTFARFWSPDGRYMLLLQAATPDQAELWQIAPPKMLRHVALRNGNLAFGPGSRIYAHPEGVLVRIYETATGKLLQTLPSHGDFVNCVTISPDEQRLAVGVSRTGAVWLWDLPSGQLLRTLQGHGGDVWGVAFSPDGHWLVATSTGGNIRLWDGRPLTDELRTEREARTLLDRLYAEPGAEPDVAARLDGDPTVGEALRQKALALAPLYKETLPGRQAYWLLDELGKQPLLAAEVVEEIRRRPGIPDAVRQKALSYAKDLTDSPDRLNNLSWQLVCKPGGNSADYSRGLRLAHTACRLAANNGNCLNTLGVAYYRTGQYQLALDTLTQSDSLNAKSNNNASLPVDLAFLAMSCQQLGQAEKAKTHLARLLESMQEPRWTNDPESQSFLREAQEALAMKPPKPPRK